MEKLDIHQASARAGLSVTRLKQLVREGAIKASQVPCKFSKFGYSYEFDRAEIAAFLEKPRRPAGRPLMTAKSATKTAPLVAEVVTPADVKRTIVDAPPPRFQTVDIPSNRPPCTSRAGSQDFRKHQRPGRF